MTESDEVLPHLEDAIPSKKAEAIRDLTAAGFSLIPLNGKIPSIRNWGATPVGKYGEVELVGGNYGVVIPATVLVVDVDPRNFSADDKPVSRLMTDLGISFPKTFTVRTGGDGLHIYFRIPPGLAIVNDLKKYPGVEFKSVKRQVVGPGSIHPDTNKEYVIAAGEPGQLADAPSELLRIISKIQTPSSNLEVDANALTDYKRDEGTIERFTSFLKTTAEPSIEGQNGDINAFKIAATGRDMGLPPDMAFSLMVDHWNDRCSPPWNLDDLKVKIINAYKFAAGPLGGDHPAAAFTPVPFIAKNEGVKWDQKPGGSPKKNFKNLLNYLRSSEHGFISIFGHNEFTNTTQIVNPAPWHRGVMPRQKTVSDHDLKMLKGHLAVKCDFEMPVSAIEEAVVVSSNDNRFHPVREYLSSLIWDKTPRLDTWLGDYCGAADDDYTRACARKVLCAAVMRVFKPGCKFDHVLVLEGEQGIGKTAICKILGGEWYGDFKVDPGNKDTVQLLQGRWIVELAELAVTRISDVDALKAFISREVDTARLAYGRLALEFPRQSIFIATKNPSADNAYLKDDTGNRRWWPVQLNPKGRIDFTGLKAVRNQLFAEAVERVRSGKGERLDMDTPELSTAAQEVVAQRHAEHAWTERVATWIQGLPLEREFLTARDVFLEAMDGLDKQFDRQAAIAIAGIMRTLKWAPGFKRINGRFSRGYVRSKNSILGDLI